MMNINFGGLVCPLSKTMFNGLYEWLVFKIHIPDLRLKIILQYSAIKDYKN